MIIDDSIIGEVDLWLDRYVSAEYQNQPLAQDWARVAKLTEEVGEAINELILATGQNPRKGHDRDARERLMKELADTVMTGIYAIQHFTKDVRLTGAIVSEAQARHYARLVQFYQSQSKSET